MIGIQKYGRLKLQAVMLVFFLLFTNHARSQTDLPDIPDLIRVTVEHTDPGVLIQWQASTDDDIESYWIWKMRPDLSFERIMQFEGSIREYKHRTPGLKNLTYSVTAVDSAGNESLFGKNIHRAVSMTPEFEPCSPANVITWSAYEGWEGQVSGYKIYGAAEGDIMQMLSFVDFSTLSYTHEGISTGTSYAYYIETIHTSGLNSLSAIDSVEAVYPEAPEYIQVDFVTVMDQSTAEIQFTADVSGAVNNFRVMKRSNPGTPYKEVQTFWDESQSTRLIQDEFPTATISYEYMIQSVFQPPTCKVPLVLSQSNSGNSVLLEYSIESQMVILSWTPYESYSTGLSGYTIQRRSGSGEFYDIQTVGPGIISWSEAIQSVINGFQPGELQYRVLAISNPQFQGQSGISVSNITTVTVETSMQVPSAFTPGSNDMNFEFKPLLDFAPRKYLMMIMDRGGRKMFETTDPGKGWDGRFLNGEFVNEGVYVYYIQYTDYTGRFKSHTGNVTVLYP
ncbi:MAG: gliding motility-associated C-terminal domain-containing protein [Bacteroidota bacterium]